MHSRSSNHQQRLKYKKKIKINSLQAAICNVALFKSMKDKQFRDTIFISYCEDGVILEAVSEGEWKRANDYIFNFLNNKKIALLTFGYEKEQYENLISKGLKEITRRIKEKDEECPYINIIHYQKIRKSCEYMDKQKYVEPLKDWETKNKRNPNFAFLIVEPAQKFDEVKKGLLEFLTGEHVPLKYVWVDPINFIYLFFYSKIKEKIKDAFNKKLLQISLDEPDPDNPTATIKLTSFTTLNLKQYSYIIIPANKHVITKSGLEYLSQDDLKAECKNSKSYCKESIVQHMQNFIVEQQKIQKENFVVIPYRKQEQQKYQAIINKYINSILSKQQIMRKLQSNVVCSFEDIEIIDDVDLGDEKKSCYRAMKTCINDCQFLVIEYSAEEMDLESFIVYLDQLRLYYCSYLIRFYGISLKYKQPQHNPTSSKKTEKLLTLSSQNSHLELSKIYLIFDFHSQSLQKMYENDMILDNMQVGSIILQLLYCINYLHTHQQPRCLGPISLSQVYWPMCIILPYLGSPFYMNDRQKQGYSIENDIKQVGDFMKFLMNSEEQNQKEQIELDEDFEQIIENMTRAIKQERWGLKKCITELEQILFV